MSLTVKVKYDDLLDFLDKYGNLPDGKVWELSSENDHIQDCKDDFSGDVLFTIGPDERS